MTSVLAEEESKVARMKQKLMNDHAKEETRSFLSFSRENLSISQSDLEQRFNKHRFRPNRNTVLSVAALIIALLCLALESWKFHCSLVNAREIEELKRNVENLKHRFLEEDLLDQLKAFQEKLYAGESNDDDDPGEADIENAEYDSNYDSSYDEDTFNSHPDYSSDYQSSPVFGRRPSDFPDSSSTIAPVPSPPQPSPNKAMMELLAEMPKHGRELKRHHQRNAERDRHEEKKALEGKSEEQKKNDAKPRRDASGADDTGNVSSKERKMISKHKRSIGGENGSKRLFVNRHFPRSKTRRMVSYGSGSTSRETLEDKSDEEKQNVTSATVSSRHPPKKYYTHSSLDTGDVTSPVRNEESNAQTATNRPRKPAHRLRKHMSHPRKIVAVHYDGDRNGYTRGVDDYAHNGKIRHGTSVFKAWKASNWVDSLGMSQYFKMGDDGSVTVYETGLYLVYAQIHYNDDHDEIGFHLQVNNQSILQCMIDNSHNSRSISQTCFSAQLTPLHKEDVLVFKEASSPRYAIFDKINSFFGMVKLGELTRPAH